MKHEILLKNPAETWDNASPLGSGRMGMMVYGLPSTERLSLNEESIWSEAKRSTELPDFRDKIDHLRALFLSGRGYEADAWAQDEMKDDFFTIRAYEYAGELRIKTKDGQAEDYKRVLDLDRGICTVSYRIGSTSFKSESFASHPDDVMVYRLQANEAFDSELSLYREKSDLVTYESGYMRMLATTAEGGHRFCTAVKVVSDGEFKPARGSLFVMGATCVTIYIAVRTSFRYADFEARALADLEAAKYGFDELCGRHTEDFSSLMERSDISFGDDKLADMPTDQRLARLKASAEASDPALSAIYFAFGKYLLISSSRADTLPANLQGVWAEGLTPPWNADYHTNINLQMNYWGAEVSNLSECTNALFRYMNDILLDGGREVARVNYRCRGTVVHHISDIYGFAAAGDGIWGLWPMGAAWLSYHMWDHYLFTRDEKFLRDVAYEFIAESARFFMDFMFEDQNGVMHTGPCNSPENSYYVDTPDGKREMWLSISPTMDVEIVGGLFRFYIECERLLGIDPNGAKEAERILAKMPPLKISKEGYLQEWLEDYEEVDRGHRHISHAFALYPGYQINRTTPELFDAVKATMQRRLSAGGGHTGWSCAWLINLYARLHDGEGAEAMLRKLYTASTYDNLFDRHPPFQIDGNFGGSAAIAEMLLQSHEGYISVLPAISRDLATGSFRALRARGGYTVSCDFEAGKIKKLTIVPDSVGAFDVEIPESQSAASFVTGGEDVIMPQNGKLHFEGTAGESIVIDLI